MKKGRGKNSKKGFKTLASSVMAHELKKTSSFPVGLDSEGYEVTVAL